MLPWYPCTTEDALQIQLAHFKNDNALVLLSYEHLGDEEEPLDLFIWGDFETKEPVLRSALAITKEQYWRTYDT